MKTSNYLSQLITIVALLAPSCSPKNTATTSSISSTESGIETSISAPTSFEQAITVKSVSEEYKYVKKYVKVANSWVKR